MDNNSTSLNSNYYNFQESFYRNSTDMGNFDDNRTSGASLGDIFKQFLKPVTFRRSLTTWEETVIIVFYVLVATVAAIGNILIMIAFKRNTRLRNVTNSFLLSLATSDLLIAIFTIPFQLCQNLYIGWGLGKASCQFAKYSHAVFMLVSSLTLTAIALDRCLLFHNPWRTRSLLTMKRACVVISLLWLSAGMMMIPRITFSGIQPKYIDGNIMHICVFFVPQHIPNFSKIWISVEAASFFLVPFVIICVSYTLIGIRLSRREITGGDEATQRIIKQNKRINIMIICVMLAFGLTWIPYYAFKLYLNWTDHHLGDLNRTKMILSHSFELLGYSNAAMNPFIYCLLNQVYRSEMKSIFSSCPLKKYWMTVISYSSQTESRSEPSTRNVNSMSCLQTTAVTEADETKV